MKKIKTMKNDLEKQKYLESLLKDNEIEPTKYNIKAKFLKGQLLKHSKFGYGFILKIISHSKIEVYFENEEKILVQNWSNA